MLTKILSGLLLTGAGITFLTFILRRTIPKEKMGNIVEGAGDWLSSTGGIRFGKKFWEGLEDYFIEIIDYWWGRFKIGLRKDNPRVEEKLSSEK